MVRACRTPLTTPQASGRPRPDLQALKIFRSYPATPYVPGPVTADDRVVLPTVGVLRVAEQGAGAIGPPAVPSDPLQVMPGPPGCGGKAIGASCVRSTGRRDRPARGRGSPGRRRPLRSGGRPGLGRAAHATPGHPGEQVAQVRTETKTAARSCPTASPRPPTNGYAGYLAEKAADRRRWARAHAQWQAEWTASARPPLPPPAGWPPAGRSKTAARWPTTGRQAASSSRRPTGPARPRSAAAARWTITRHFNTPFRDAHLQPIRFHDYSPTE